MNVSKHSRAFTLLELVMVMVLIVIILSIAAPSLRGWSRGSRLRDATDDFLSLTRYARTQAIAKSAICRVNVDPGSGRCWVSMQDGQKFTDDPDEDAKRIAPSGYRVDVQVAQPTAPNAIDFY